MSSLKEIGINGRLGEYLNTMVANLGISNKGKYLRELFGKYEKECLFPLISSQKKESATASSNKLKAEIALQLNTLANDIKLAGLPYSESMANRVYAVVAQLSAI